MPFHVITELNSTSSSTSNLGELIDDDVSDEVENKRDESVLYMRGAFFMIRLDAAQNLTSNTKTKSDDTNEIPNRFDGLSTLEVRICLLSFVNYPSKSY